MKKKNFYCEEVRRQRCDVGARMNCFYKSSHIFILTHFWQKCCKNKKKHLHRCKCFGEFSFVIPPRFERGTYCLEGSCSIQLSYGTFCFFIGRDDSTRTSDPLVPNQVFCQLNYIPYPPAMHVRMNRRKMHAD